MKLEARARIDRRLAAVTKYIFFDSPLRVDHRSVVATNGLAATATRLASVYMACVTSSRRERAMRTTAQLPPMKEEDISVAVIMAANSSVAFRRWGVRCKVSVRWSSGGWVWNQ